MDGHPRRANNVSYVAHTCLSSYRLQAYGCCTTNLVHAYVGRTKKIKNKTVSRYCYTFTFTILYDIIVRYKTCATYVIIKEIVCPVREYFFNQNNNASWYELFQKQSWKTVVSIIVILVAWNSLGIKSWSIATWLKRFSKIATFVISLSVIFVGHVHVTGRTLTFRNRCVRSSK